MKSKGGKRTGALVARAGTYQRVCGTMAAHPILPGVAEACRLPPGHEPPCPRSWDRGEELLLLAQRKMALREMGAAGAMLDQNRRDMVERIRDALVRRDAGVERMVVDAVVDYVEAMTPTRLEASAIVGSALAPPESELGDEEGA